MVQLPVLTFKKNIFLSDNRKSKLTKIFGIARKLKPNHRRPYSVILTYSIDYRGIHYPCSILSFGYFIAKVESYLLAWTYLQSLSKN